MMKIQDENIVLSECLEISQLIEELNEKTHRWHQSNCPYSNPGSNFAEDEELELLQKLNEYGRTCYSYHWSYSTNHTVDSSPYYYILWRTKPHPTGIIVDGERSAPTPEFCGHARLCDLKKVLNRMIDGQSLEKAWEL